MPPRKIPKSRKKKSSSENSDETSAILKRLRKTLRVDENSEEDDVGVDLDDVEEDPIIVAVSNSHHSNLLQFLHKENAQVQKELNDGKTTFSSINHFDIISILIKIKTAVGFHVKIEVIFS